MKLNLVFAAIALAGCASLLGGCDDGTTDVDLPEVTPAEPVQAPGPGANPGSR